MLQTTSFGSENYLFSRHYPVDSPHENITLKTANHESIQQKGACHALFPESHSEGRDKPACKVDKPLRRTVSVARGSRIQACQQTVYRAPAENPFRLSRRAMSKCGLVRFGGDSRNSRDSRNRYTLLWAVDSVTQMAQIQQILRASPND